jgi:hypothetical protein
LQVASSNPTDSYSILPKAAMAKISVRTVPRQNPARSVFFSWFLACLPACLLACLLSFFVGAGVGARALPIGDLFVYLYT